MIRFALPLFAVLAAAAPALADMPPRPSDTVVLSLAAEGWVETATAEVVVSAEAAAPGSATGNESTQIRDDLLETIRSLAPEADWRLVRAEPSTDPAGLSRWRVVARARVPEPLLGGLHEKARQVSRPGRQLRVEAVDFEPSLTEIESVRSRLRQDIYRRAQEELEALNAVYGARDFRLGSIEFLDVPPPGPPQPMSAMRMDSAAMEAAPPVTVSEKLRLQARITLRAEPPPAPAP